MATYQTRPARPRRPPDRRVIHARWDGPGQAPSGGYGRKGSRSTSVRTGRPSNAASRLAEATARCPPPACRRCPATTMPRRAHAAVAERVTAFLAAVDSSSSLRVKTTSEPESSVRAVPAGELGGSASRADRGVLPHQRPSGHGRCRARRLSTGMVSAKARLATALALPSTPREEGRRYAVVVLGAGPGAAARYHLLGLEHRPLLLVHRLVHLDELAVGQLPDDARLVAVQQLPAGPYAAGPGRYVS